MEYSKQVEAAIEKIAVFAIKSKALAPKSIMYNVERTRLMETALGLQLVAMNMDARLGRQVPISKFEIDNFKRELDCTHGNIIDLHQLLEVQGKYSDNNTNKGITPSESAPARSVTNYLGRVLVSEGSQQRSIPGTPETPRNSGHRELTPESLCSCPKCANLLLSPGSEQSSLCSCAVCCMYPSPLARVSPVMWALSPASNTSISTDSGFESAGRQ